MSRAAMEYYQERIERLELELTQPPLLLTGRPFEVLPGSKDEGFISNRMVNTELLLEAQRRYSKLLGTLTHFLIQTAFGVNESDQSISFAETLKAGFFHGPYAMENDEHVSQAIGNYIFPPKVKTGRIFDIQVEAVARNEVPASLLRRASRKHTNAIAPGEDRSAYLVTSAQFYPGRHLGRFAGFTIAHMDLYGGLGVGIHYIGTVFSQSERRAVSELWQSRAVPVAFDEWNETNLQ